MGSNETDVEGVRPRRWLTNAGRLGIEDTISPIMCSTRLHMADSSVRSTEECSEKLVELRT